MRARLLTHPEDPCVVFPDAHGDWRWRSWRWLARAAEAWAEALGASATGNLVGYPWHPTPEAVAADLGIQLAGGIAVPATPGHEAALPPLARWLAVGGEPAPAEGQSGVAVVTEPAGAALGGHSVVAASSPAASAGELARRLEAPGTAAGGALVRCHERWEAWRAAELAGAARAFEPAPGGAGDASPQPGRPIALVAGDLAAAEERAWLGWALAADAALVLPGDTAFAAWAVFWPRPTDVCLPVEQLGPVRELLGSLGRLRAVRRRLARLRRLMVWGGSPEPAEREAWRALGVDLRPTPQLP